MSSNHNMSWVGTGRDGFQEEFATRARGRTLPKPATTRHSMLEGGGVETSQPPALHPNPQVGKTGGKLRSRFIVAARLAVSS